MNDIDTPAYEGKGETLDIEEVAKFPSRAAAAVTFFLAGYTYAEIARLFEYANAHVARAAVEHSIAASADDDSKDRMRAKIGRQLDRLLQGVWTKAIDPKKDEHISAVKAALQILEQRAKLFGLNAPAEVTVYTPSAQELEQYVSRMVERELAELPPEANIVDADLVGPDGS